MRPFAYTASVLAAALGAAIARHSGYPVRWGPFGVTLLGVLCFHTAANLRNDCFDHRRGLDTQVLPTSGAVVRGWVTEKQAFCWLPVLWSVPLSMLTVGILHANNGRDIETDGGRGCRTVASLLGTGGSRIYYRVLVLGPFVKRSAWGRPRVSVAGTA